MTDSDLRTIGPYQLVRKLGAGGMGTVYAAVDGDGRRAAVKVIHRELAHDAEFRTRFAREVTLLRRVHGPFTARVLNADTEAGQPWLATEYVPGQTLAQRVTDGGPMPEQAVIGLAAGLAEALRGLHGANVVHRDLKPSNVILSPAGPRLIDMGIARALDETSVTRTGAVVGSPGWISPEEYRSGEAGPAADVYGWALLMLYASTGRMPYGTGRPDVLAMRVLSETPDVSGVPDVLVTAVQHALSKDPTERPTADELLHAAARSWRTSEVTDEDLTQFLDHTWVMPAEDEFDWAVPSLPRPKRSPAKAALAVAVAVATATALAVVAVVLMSTPTSTSMAKPSRATLVLSIPSSPAAKPRDTRPSTKPLLSPTKAGKPTTTLDGKSYILPPGWKVVEDVGASGGMTCIFPAKFTTCDDHKIVIYFGIQPDEDFNLDEPDTAAGSFCPGDLDRAGLEERELRRNSKNEYQHRTYTVACAGGTEFTIYSAYFPAGDDWIVAAGVPKADIDSVIASFSLD